jgi:hypothetical protein
MMQVQVISLLGRFDAPVPWERVLWLEGELAGHAIRESRREGIPRGCRVGFRQVTIRGADDVGQAMHACATSDAAVVLMPADAELSRSIAAKLPLERCVLLHQNLDPAMLPNSCSLRLGMGVRGDKLKVAAALVRDHGGTPPILVSRLPVAGTPLDGLVRVMEGPRDPADAQEWLRQAVDPASEELLILECGGATNRAIAAFMAGRMPILFLNGNPDTADPAASSRVREVVGNLPERIGGALAASVATVTGDSTLEDLDTAGMLAWRLDGVRLTIASADRLTPSPRESLSKALHRRMLQFDGTRSVFRGWHRPMWFGADGCNRGVETVVARVDAATRRRVTADFQVADAAEGGARIATTLGVDIDFVSISDIKEDAGTFEAELVVRVDGGAGEPGVEPSQVLRILNMTATPEWLSAVPDGPRVIAQGLRGTFEFTPDLALYPVDRQLLAIRVAPTGVQRGIVMRPIPTCRDTDCELVGWRVACAHRGVTYAVRPSTCGLPGTVQGIEFGLHLARARADVPLRVCIPLVLLASIATVAVAVAEMTSLEVTVGLLGSVFLTAVALYFSEPKPAPGARTLVDAIYQRVFVLFALLLVATLIATQFGDERYPAIMRGIAIAIVPAAFVLLWGIKAMVGPARWRILASDRW